MIPFSSLTDAQREQVAHIFYDDLFCTDPAHFEYLVKDEIVCNRYRVVTNGDVGPRSPKPRKVPVSLKVMEVEGGNADEVIKSIARHAVEQCIANQTQEA